MSQQEKGEGEYPTIVFVNSRYGPVGRESVLKETSEVVEVSQFKTTPAIIHRGYGVTINQGNYESARVDVSVSLPCYVEDLEHADEYARQFVEKRIVEEIASVRGDKKPEPEKKGPKRLPGGSDTSHW